MAQFGKLDYHSKQPFIGLTRKVSTAKKPVLKKCVTCPNLIKQGKSQRCKPCQADLLSANSIKYGKVTRERAKVRGAKGEQAH